MSRTKRIAKQEATADDPAEDGQTGAQTDARANVAEAELETVAQQLPEGARGTIHRFIEGGEREWCEDIAAAEFSPARVRAKWGPGRYIVYWRKPHAEVRGRTVGAGTTRFVLAAGVEEPRAGAPASADVRAAEAVTGMVVQHAKAMLDGQQLLQQMQMAVLKNLTEPRRDSELSEKLLLALIARTPQGGGTDLAGLMALADKLANRTSPTAAIKETLELLGTARELGGGGDGDTGPPWIQLAAKALDTIGRAVSRPAGQLAAPAPDGSTPAPAPDMLPAPAPAGSPGEVATLPETAHAVFHFLAPHMPALIRHATLDHDPTTYAGMIFDQLTPAYMAEVRDYISRPDFLDLLEGHFPAVRGALIAGSEPPVLVREWFGDLRDDLVARIREEIEPAAGGFSQDQGDVPA